MSPRPSTGVRERIVESAQKTFHEQGYHGSSLDEILARAGATKGGLYHHFADKEVLARVVIAERLAGMVHTQWSGTDWHANPVDHLQAVVRGANSEQLKRGCPVNALAQEVSFHAPPLKRALRNVFEGWIDAIAAGFRAGIENGTVRPDVNPMSAATYFLAVWEGFVALAKTRDDARSWLVASIDPLMEWLDSLRPA